MWYRNFERSGKLDLYVSRSHRMAKAVETDFAPGDINRFAREILI
jgi:hypothetical protein